MRRLSHLPRARTTKRNAAEALTEDCVYQGWLCKEGALLKSWKRRWFELRGSRLLYMAQPTGAPGEALGVVALEGRSAAVEPDAHSANPYTFVLRGAEGASSAAGRRAYHLIAMSAEDRDAWILHINRAAQRPASAVLAPPAAAEHSKRGSAGPAFVTGLEPAAPAPAPAPAAAAAAAAAAAPAPAASAPAAADAPSRAPPARMVSLPMSDKEVGATAERPAEIAELEDHARGTLWRLEPGKRKWGRARASVSGNVMLLMAVGGDHLDAVVKLSDVEVAYQTHKGREHCFRLRSQRSFRAGAAAPASETANSSGLVGIDRRRRQQQNAPVAALSVEEVVHDLAAESHAELMAWLRGWWRARLGFRWLRLMVGLRDLIQRAGAREVAAMAAFQRTFRKRKRKAFRTLISSHSAAKHDEMETEHRAAIADSAAGGAPQLHGWLEKKRMRRGGWAHRWFVLSGDLLIYFESMNTAKSTCKGSIPLSGRRAEPMPHKDRPHAFKLLGDPEAPVPQRVVYLSAGNEDDARRWIDTINLAEWDEIDRLSLVEQFSAADVARIVRVQSVVRGRAARRRVAVLRRFRALLGADTSAEQRAAALLQARVRAFRARRRVTELRRLAEGVALASVAQRRAVLRLQARFRGARDRRRALHVMRLRAIVKNAGVRESRAASLIASHIRGSIARQLAYQVTRVDESAGFQEHMVMLRPADGLLSLVFTEGDNRNVPVTDVVLVEESTRAPAAGIHIQLESGLDEHWDFGRVERRNKFCRDVSNMVKHADRPRNEAARDRWRLAVRRLRSNSAAMRAIAVTARFTELAGEETQSEVPTVTLAWPRERGAQAVRAHLTITNYRLVFHPYDTTLPAVQVPLSAIYETSRSRSDITLTCKDARSVSFRVALLDPRGASGASDWASVVHDRVARLAFPGEVFHAFAFAHRRASGPAAPEADGWRLFDYDREYERLGLTKPGLWSVLDNSDFELCATYPARIVMPALLSPEQVAECARFRSKQRVPAAVWLHPRSGAVMARCSQPMVGLQGKRSEADEFLLNVYRMAYRQGDAPPVYITDARKAVASRGNRLMGKGTEQIKHYEKTEVVYLNIANIHEMRRSYHELVDTCGTAESDSVAAAAGGGDDEGADADTRRFLPAVDSSLWLRHVQGVLRGAERIVELMERGSSVIVHCSDGWDRTAQLSATSQLLMDPFYRTVDGFAVLVEKEWCAFGHKFGDRVAVAENCGESDVKREYSPIFIQWLDCVYQLLRQSPAAFEFNELLLLHVADGCLGARYGTFLYNCERQRIAANLRQTTHSVWTPVLRHRDHFLNPGYAPVAGTVHARTSSRKIGLWDAFYFRWDPDEMARVEVPWGARVESS